jgi:hypothetical protein
MSESSNKKRKSETISVSEISSAIPETAQVELGDEPTEDASKADVSSINEAASPPIYSMQPATNVSAPQKSSLKSVLAIGLGAGLLGGVLSSFIILASPQVYSHFFASNLSSKIIAVSNDQSTQERIAAIETKLAAINATGTDVSKTDMNVSTLLSRVETLEKTPIESARPDANLSSRLEKLEAALNVPVKPQAGQAGTVLMVATDALRRKFERGVAFAPELKAVEGWADPSVNLSALKKYADTGVPNIRVISQRFNEISPLLIREATPPSTGLLERVGQAATGLVKVRSSGETKANDPASIIARVEAALARNEAGSALDDLVKLPELALVRAEPIIANLKARLDIEASILSLEQSGLQNLNSKKN